MFFGGANIIMTKKELLYEFCQTGEARGCKSIAQLEQRFSRWMRRNNISLVNRGKNYFENNFYASANYTKKILEQDRDLLYAFGLNESHLVTSRPEYRDNTGEGYSFLGQLKHYGNQVHNRGQDGEYRKSGKVSLNLGGFFKVIVGIIIVVLLYKAVGDDVWSFLTSGAIFRVICFAIAAFVSYKILRSKNMGWPLPVKLVVLFVIWLVLLKYDF